MRGYKLSLADGRVRAAGEVAWRGLDISISLESQILGRARIEKQNSLHFQM
jgi:hypothetical protein